MGAGRNAAVGAIRERERCCCGAGTAARRRTLQRDREGPEAAARACAPQSRRSGGCLGRRGSFGIDCRGARGAAHAGAIDEDGGPGRHGLEGERVTGGDLDDRRGRRWQRRGLVLVVSSSRTTMSFPGAALNRRVLRVGSRHRLGLQQATEPWSRAEGRR